MSTALISFQFLELTTQQNAETLMILPEQKRNQQPWEDIFLTEKSLDAGAVGNVVSESNVSDPVNTSEIPFSISLTITRQLPPIAYTTTHVAWPP